MLKQLKRIGLVSLLVLGTSSPVYAEVQQTNLHQEIQKIIEEKGTDYNYKSPKVAIGEHNLQITTFSESRINSRISRKSSNTNIQGAYTLELIDYIGSNEDYGYVDEIRFSYQDNSILDRKTKINTSQKAPFNQEIYSQLEAIYAKVIDHAIENTQFLEKRDFELFDRFCKSYLEQFYKEKTQEKSFFDQELLGTPKIKPSLKDTLGNLDESLKKAGRRMEKTAVSIRTPRNSSASLLGLLRFF